MAGGDLQLADFYGGQEAVKSCTWAILLSRDNERMQQQLDDMKAGTDG